MRLERYLLLMHGISAALSAALLSMAWWFNETWGFALAGVVAVVTTLIVSNLSQHRLSQGLLSIQKTLGDFQDRSTVGIAEFDEVSHQLAQSAQRWETIAVETRDQSRELQKMMTMLGRRAKDKPTSSELRSILKGLGNSLQAHLERMGQGVAESAQFHQQISDGAETQSRAVIKTTTYLEQLSTTIDSVSNNADSAQSVLRQTENTAQSALGLLEELNKGIRIIRSESHSSEKNMRALCDPTRQISAIVDSIGDIASRTDLLALNASIEAIRAGEHGRGFSLVADEVRSLAEQAAEATREINSLLASIQLVTQESLRGILREREHVEASVSRIEQAEQSLRDIGRLGQEVRSIEQISESAVRQLHLTQSVVEAVEQISVQAKSTRSHADSAGWTMKSLTNGTPQVIGMVERLQQCGRPSQEESYPPEETRDVFDPQRQLQSVS